MVFPYRNVFQQVEETLIQYGSQHLPPEEIRRALAACGNFFSSTVSSTGFDSERIAGV